MTQDANRAVAADPGLRRRIDAIVDAVSRIARSYAHFPNEDCTDAEEELHAALAAALAPSPEPAATRVAAKVRPAPPFVPDWDIEVEPAATEVERVEFFRAYNEGIAKDRAATAEGATPERETCPWSVTNNASFRCVLSAGHNGLHQVVFGSDEHLSDDGATAPEVVRGPEPFWPRMVNESTSAPEWMVERMRRNNAAETVAQPAPAPLSVPTLADLAKHLTDWANEMSLTMAMVDNVNGFESVAGRNRQRWLREAAAILRWHANLPDESDLQSVRAMLASRPEVRDEIVALNEAAASVPTPERLREWAEWWSAVFGAWDGGGNMLRALADALAEAAPSAGGGE